MADTAATEQPLAGRDHRGELGFLANRLGLELLRRISAQGKKRALSPLSIELVLAMAYSGSAGQTRKEMQQTFDFPGREEDLHASASRLVSAIRQALEARPRGAMVGDTALSMATRLYGQRNLPYRREFLATLQTRYEASTCFLDFDRNPEGARREINTWVAGQTQNRIQDLVQPGALDRETRMVIVNAIYLKIPWKHKFDRLKTAQLAFSVNGTSTEPVPTMETTAEMGYLTYPDFTVLAIPYVIDELQFLVILPRHGTTMPDLMRTLTASTMSEFAELPRRQVLLFLPTFKVEPPVIPLSPQLEDLGMKAAFEPGRADFRGIDSRRDIYIKDIFHKVFILVEEQGTEATATTGAVFAKLARTVSLPPIEVRVDRPFLFAIQHRPSGACLFLGYINDPR